MGNVQSIISPRWQNHSNVPGKAFWEIPIYCEAQWGLIHLCLRSCPSCIKNVCPSYMLCTIPSCWGWKGPKNLLPRDQHYIFEYTYVGDLHSVEQLFKTWRNILINFCWEIWYYKSIFICALSYISISLHIYSFLPSTYIWLIYELFKSSTA